MCEVLYISDGSGFSSIPGGDNQEKLIYQIISEAGNKGEWNAKA